MVKRTSRREALVTGLVSASVVVVLIIGVWLLLRYDAVAVANDLGFQGLSQDIRQNILVSAHSRAILLLASLSAYFGAILVVLSSLSAYRHGREWPVRSLPEGMYVVASILDRGDESHGNNYATLAVRHVERVKGCKFVTFWYQVCEVELRWIVGEVDGDTLVVKSQEGSPRYYFVDSVSS